MYRLFLFVLFLVCTSALSEDCVTETFENNFEENFTNKTSPTCSLYPMWYIDQYTTLNVKSPHPLSTSFIALQQPSLNCMTSYNFNITRGGTVEVNRYMMSKNDLDAVFVDVMMYAGPLGASDLAVTGSSFSPKDSNFVPGWRVHSIRVPGQGSFVGYIRFRGKASPDSVVLIDSFRYIAPSFNKDLCVIYKEDKTSVSPTTDSTTTELPTTKPTTKETSTTNVNTETSTTPISTTAPTTIPSTTRPRFFSISLLLVKINKFFR